MFRYLAAAAALAIATPASAAWQKAESDHFVIYADEKPADLQAFGEALERYHSAMEYLTHTKLDKPSPSNRVTIYVVGSEKTISQLAGDKMVAGFYQPRAGGSVAFVPDIQRVNGDLPFSAIVLLHEYAHHFLISSQRFAMPRWLSEGSAEFFASAHFEKDGTVGVGRPAMHRAGELAFAKDVTVEELVDPAVYEKRHGRRYDAFYGRSWALYHYLVFDKAREGQFGKYWAALASGMDSRKAAETTFGDLKALDRELDRYLAKRSMYGFTLSPDKVPAGSPIRVTPLSAGLAEAMPLVVRSKNGVNAEQAAALVGEVRTLAARYPQDAGVQTALAEAEYDAGNDDAAIAAADRAIAADPEEKNAFVQKGYALFRKAEDASDRQAAVKAALVPFTALNRLEVDHPLPLIYYYRSFYLTGRAPDQTARHALERASMLAPFDKGLAYEAAMMQAQEGKISLARHWLGPVAADPHGGSFGRKAQVVSDLLSRLPEGKPVDMAALERDANLQLAVADAAAAVPVESE